WRTPRSRRVHRRRAGPKTPCRAGNRRGRFHSAARQRGRRRRSSCAGDSSGGGLLVLGGEGGRVGRLLHLEEVRAHFVRELDPAGRVFGSLSSKADRRKSA